MKLFHSLKENAKKKGIKLEAVYNKKEIILDFDERSLISILNNLINNALKFTNEGSVTTAINLFENYFEMKVSDTGIGIAEKDQELIFDEFRQASEGYSRNFEGTGLGLSITKKIVDKFNGTISLDSKVGKGSTFTIRIPIIKNENVKSSSDDKSGSFANEMSANIHDKPLALLVDNDPFVFEVLKRYTKDLINLDKTVDAEYAIEMIKKKQYDLIFMDINLGSGLDGKEATIKIRTIDSYKDIPIIATTAYAMPGDKEEFLSAGCSHYLSKPFSKKDVISLLNKILNLNEMNE